MAITPTFCCGFECGVANAHWQLTGTASFSTTTFNNDLRSGRANPTASTGTWAGPAGTFNANAPNTVSVNRFYLRFATLPSADTLIATTTAAANHGLFFQQSTGQLFCRVNGANGVTGAVVTTGVWYRIDLKSVTDATPTNITIDAQVDGAALGTAGPAAIGPAGNLLLLGAVNTCTADIFFDDVVSSNTSADYPIGAGKVLSFVPNADGTHTATSTHIVKGTAATPVGAAITSATSDAFNWVNARPIGGGATDATRLINQQTLLTTEYAEVDFEPTTETNPPRAVEVLTADQQATTASGGFSTKLNDNGTENVIITRSGAGVVTDRFITKQYATMPADSAAWTLGRFNALKARFGYSGDATPDQYWRGIMIEAEFAIAADTLFAQACL